MAKGNFERRLIEVALASFLASGVWALGTEKGLACSGHCQQARMCAALMKQKALKEASARREEYQKCMRDPQNYK